MLTRETDPRSFSWAATKGGIRNSNHDFGSFLGFVRLLLPDGQRDGYGGPLIQHAVDSNLTLVSPYVSVADAEAKARAFVALGGEERFEDVRQDIRRDSAAGVTDADFDAVRERKFVGGNRDTSAARCRLGRIH